MTDLWYYTSNGQQQEPVSAGELKRLASSGTLRPTDLVWKDGMAEWTAAGTVKGLYSVGTSGAAEGYTERSRPAAAPPAAEEAKARPRRRPVDDEDDENPDERPRRRRAVESEDEDPIDERPRRRRVIDDDDDEEEVRPRRRRRRAGMSAGAKAAIIGGTVVLGLVIIVGIVIFALAGGGGDGTRSFSLADGQAVSFKLRFNAGKKVEIWVNSTGNSDVDLYVFDSNGAQVRFDDGDSKDCYLWFLTQGTQTYKVEVKNMHRVDQLFRNGHNSGTLTFKESDGTGVAPPPPQVPQGRLIGPGPGRGPGRRR
jgi:hypothetical protein